MIDMDTKRISTGLKNLDDLIDGGFPQKTVILISGSPGTGKTLFGLNFLIDGAKKNEKCCYISFSEDPEELLRACKSINLEKDANNHINKNLILQKIDLEEISLKKFIETLKKYPKIDRLVIDNANKLFLFSENDKKYRHAMNNIINDLKTRSTCSLLICETIDDEIDSGKGESFESDGAIKLSFLDYEEKPKRILEIHKLRYSSFDPKVAHDLTIDKNGIKLTKAIII